MTKETTTFRPLMTEKRFDVKCTCGSNSWTLGTMPTDKAKETTSILHCNSCGRGATFIHSLEYRQRTGTPPIKSVFIRDVGLLLSKEPMFPKMETVTQK